MKHKKDFFLTEFDVKGPLRIPQNQLEEIFKSDVSRKIVKIYSKKVLGWAEIIYMNDLTTIDISSRAYILAWLFSTLQKHHEVAHVYAHRAAKKFSADKFFNVLKTYSGKKLKRKLYSIATFTKILKVIYIRTICKLSE